MIFNMLENGSKAMMFKYVIYSMTNNKNLIYKEYTVIQFFNLKWGRCCYDFH